MLELTRSGVKKGREKDLDEIYSGIYDNLYHGKDYPLLRLKKLKDLPKTVDSGSGGIIAHNIHNWLLKDADGGVTGTGNTTPTGTCHPFSKKIFLTTDGKILPCERIDHKYALGHVEDRVILDFQAVADTFNHFFDNMAGLCASCANARYCKKCMFTCRVEKKHPVCNSYSGQKDFMQKLSDNIRYMEDRPGVYHKLITEI